ncbi:low affinity iron permease family protein [Alkanindiges illinoisensis]|uniref:Low affinity iron permease family protein n=1 Tax=Alkanindiges illinoisensis TaxID=197183 RepID=A0A4Y7XF19_9GAMM|nr:low affinity iron permease family protein [Alkanindiges illinoisensis]TEU30283.1 low affinity iron permease family protein [Alkanindiges illinoisensis]
MSMTHMYEGLAKQAAKYSGRPVTFLIATLVVIVWAVSGPIFHYSDTWQLVINTGTTIITFLMVFLIQNTQNTDTTAIQLKLDELIRVKQAADNSLLNLEDMDAASLEKFREKYLKLAKEACEKIEERVEEQEINEQNKPTA